MALLWFDGFDHYGLDETKLTEGPYDQVDAAFTLSEANPRTGARCLRRDSSQTDDRVLKDLGGLKKTFGSGASFNFSQLPMNSQAFAIFQILDIDENVHVTITLNPNGSISVLRGGHLGNTLAGTDGNLFETGKYAHIEFGIRPDIEAVETTTAFIERFVNGLDEYAIEDPEFFSIDDTPFGNGVVITNVADAGAVDGGAVRAIPPEQYERVTFYGRVNSNSNVLGLDTDIAIFNLRSDSASVISTILSRDDQISGSDERLFIQNTAIGTEKLTVGEWYFFDYVIDWTSGNFDFTVTGHTEGEFATGTLSFSNVNPITKLEFTTDVEAAEALGDSGTYADVNLFISGITGNDTGIFELRVNGVTEISESSLNLLVNDNTEYRFLSLVCGGSFSSHGVTTDIDDWYVWDDSGAWNNSFLGDKRALLRPPNADTNVSDFEPSSGDFGYQMIDEDSPDEDATFILAESALMSGSPPSGSSEFEIQNLPNGVSHIAGVSVFTRAAKTDLDDAEIFTSIISGINSVSGSLHELAETYSYHVDLYEYDPATIANFTKDGFDLSLVSISAEFAVGPGSPEGSPGEGSPGEGSPGGPSIPSDFVARYLFDGDFTDESGTYDGTNAGATFLTAGDGPGGTDFGINVGGGSKQVNLPVALAAALGTGEGTISFAIRSSAITNVAIVLSGSDTGSNNRFFIPEYGNGSNLFPRVVSSPAGSASIVRGTTAGSINTWEKVIIRSSGSAWSFRLGGANLAKNVDSGTDNGAWFGDVESIDNMIIGFLDRSSSDTGAQPFDLAFLTLYDRELSDAECEQLEAEW